MNDRVPRAQVKLMAVMVSLMWWSYFAWQRPVMLPLRHEKRLVFPPGPLEQDYRHKDLRYLRARHEPAGGVTAFEL